MGQKRELSKKLEDVRSTLNASGSTSNKGKGKMTGGINYEDGDFLWISSLKKKMKNVFGIDSFRLCQLGCV
jgi:ATP-dependent DNA helicase Q1